MPGRGGRASPHQGPPGPGDSILRAKYLDYCSARVAETLLLMSPDEIFLLARDAARDPSGERSTTLSYDEVVQLATGLISRQLDLPPFERWAEAYRRDPSQFDHELLGLWESELREETD